MDMLTGWIAALNGEPAGGRGFAQWPSLGIGHHRFAGLPDYVSAPEIGYHYISVTLGDPLQVEGILSGGRMAADVRKGQVIIMAAGQANTWRWSNPTEEAHVFLDPRLVSRVAGEAGYRSTEVLNRCAVDDDQIRHIVISLVEEMMAPGPGSAMMVETGAQLLAHHLLRRHSAGPARDLRTGGLAPSQLQAIEAYAEEHLADDISLATLAAVVGLSPFHFARAFKQAAGRSPHVWLTERRMARARHLVETSALSILEIANSVGFESQSHFGQVFRKHAGLSPIALRRLTRS
jgi:AraC family transcriptional regulator